MPENQTDIKRYLDLKEGEKKALIDPQEIKELNDLIKWNLETSEKQKEQLRQQLSKKIEKHHKDILKGMSNFLGSSKFYTLRQKVILDEESRNIIKSYISVLNFIEQTLPTNNQELNNIKTAYLKQLNPHEGKAEYEKYSNKLNEIFWNTLDKYHILHNTHTVKTILEDFFALHNVSAQHKLSIDNFTTEVYKLSHLQKESFATHLATILSGSKKWGLEHSKQLRKELFWHLYKQKEEVPVLNDWIPLLHWDGSITKSFLSTANWNADQRIDPKQWIGKMERGWFDYNTNEKGKILSYREYDVQWPIDNQDLSLAFMARGVDQEWALITLTFEDDTNKTITIKGKTLWGAWVNANSIIFNTVSHKGIKFEDWALIFDKEVFSHRPPIKIKSESIDKDEVMLNVFTAWVINSNKETRDVTANGNKEYFYEGAYEPNADFSKEIQSIQQVLQERVADGGKFEISIGAETSDTRVTEHLQQKLATDLPKLQKTLTDIIHSKFQNPEEATTYLTNIQAQILAPNLIKDNFNGDQANYMLALARLYGMINTFIQDLSAQDIKKVQFKLTSFKKNIGQEKGTRKSFFYPKKL